MPKPVLIGSTFYLRVRVPRDVRDVAAGTTVSLPIGDRICQVRINKQAKTSLRTIDRVEAKRRFTVALAALERHWEALRAGPVQITHKNAVALAGEVRADFIRIFDEEPGEVERWGRVAASDALALAGQLNPLAVPTAQTRAADIERRFGGLTDAALGRRGLVVDHDSRQRVLQQVSLAMVDVSLLNTAKALGDYSDSGATDRYPPYTPKEKPMPSAMGNAMTFASVIDKEVAGRSTGKDAKPIPERTVTKFRRVADEFAAFLNSDDVGALTARQADEWKRAMLDAGDLSSATIAQRLQNLRTIVEWARKHSFGELFPTSNPLDLVDRPQRNGVKSFDRTLRMVEATTILTAARSEEKPDLRWLPWLCAYSGARIEEVAQLTPDDFFEYEGRWFFRITTKGGKSLKNAHSIRRVPAHTDLVAEGLLDFVHRQGRVATQRMFSSRAQGNVRGWVRDKLKLTRKEMAPNHGWRHLFEDVAMSAGMLDSAKTYITGRAATGSAGGYGKSDVMLPGLAREMQKIPSYLSKGQSRTD